MAGPGVARRPGVDVCVYIFYDVGMTGTTTIRVDRATRDVLNELAARRGQSVSATVDRAVRLLTQEIIGTDLRAPLREDEEDWLDADAG